MLRIEKSEVFTKRDQIERICRRQINFAKMTISLCDRVESTVGKGENAVN